MSDRPFLVTERLELWLPRAADLDEAYALVTTGETARFLGQVADRSEYFNRFMRGAGSWQLYGYGMFQVRPRGGGAIVGACGVFHTMRGLGEDFDDNPEAGWILRHDHLGQGYGTEVMQAVLAWFERTHGRRRIVCMIAPENQPSLKLAAKLGFIPFRDTELPSGEAVRLLERVPERMG